MELKELKINYNNNELSYKCLPNDIIFNKLIITFDKNIYNSTSKLNQGEINITFKNPNDKNGIIALLNLFFIEISKQKQITPNLNIVFEINIKNKDDEEKMAQYIKNEANKSFQFNVIYKNDPKQINNQQKIIEQEKQQEILATGSKQIQKEGMHNETKYYVETDGKIYDDNQTLSITEKNKKLLEEWKKDSAKTTEINNLSPEELNKKITKVNTMNLKQHDLTSPTNLNNPNNNEFENLSNNVAHEKDGKVNEELGIIENSNQFTTIEETKDNKLNIVTPTVNEQTIINNNTKNNTISYSSNYTYTESVPEENIKEEEISQREVATIFYIDYNTGMIYDSNNNEIGKLGPDSGYTIDENNNLNKNGQVVGPVDDIRNMSQHQTKNNVRKRVLKPDGYTSFLMISVLISLVFIIYILITLL